MDTSAFIVRDATQADIPAITRIYNQAVVDTVATMDIEPVTLENRTEWFDKHGGRFPVLVCEDDGHVVGWASLSPWSDRAGYLHAAEASVYIEQGRTGRGLGTELLQELLERARRLDYHTVLGQIADTNTASLRLVTSCGFEDVGTIRQVGLKFGQWIDVRVVQFLVQADGHRSGW